MQDSGPRGPGLDTPVLKRASARTHVLVEFLSEGAPVGSSLTQKLQGPFGQPHRPHAVVQPARAQTTLGDLKTPPFPWTGRDARMDNTITNWGGGLEIPLDHEGAWYLLFM